MPTTTPVGTVGEFAASRHGALSRRQAAGIGLTPQQIRRMIDRDLLREPVPGVLVMPDAPRTWRQELMIATLACNSAGVGGFESSAALHCVDGFQEGPLTIVLRSPRKILVERVVVHVGPLSTEDVVEIDGIPCTSIERTLCDLGSSTSELRSRMAFEWYWRTKRDLRPLQAAVDRLHRPGQHGTRLMQELLVEARLKGRPTESPLEVRLEAIIGDLDGLVRQYEVFDSAGRFLGRPDFAIPSQRIAIEAHSRQFHSSDEARIRDAIRDENLTNGDWTVRYVTSKEMDHPSKLRSSVRRMVLLGEVSPGLPTFE